MELESWAEFIEKENNDIHMQKSNGSELYFETNDYDSFIEKLNIYNDFKIEFVRKTKEFP